MRNHPILCGYLIAVSTTSVIIWIVELGRWLAR